MSAYSDLVLSSAPVAYWPLQETAGSSTASDISGAGLDLSVTNDAGVSPNGLDFGSTGPFSGETALAIAPTGSVVNGTGSSTGLQTLTPTPSYLYRAVPSLALPSNTPQTREAWLRFDGTQLFYGGWLSLIRSSDDAEYAATVVGSQEYAFDTPATWCVNIQGYHLGGTGHAESANNTLAASVWAHVVWTWDGTTHKIYINRTLVSLAMNHAWSALGAGTIHSIYIGHEPGPGTPGMYWEGALAHVALYDRALRECEVLAHYDLATTGTYTPCPEGLRYVHPVHGESWSHDGETFRVKSTGHIVFESADALTRIRAADADVLTHDGTTLSVHSGSDETLRVPFPVASSPPAVFLGMDAASGLPATSALPTPANHGLAPVVPPVPVVTTTSTCDALRCGAAALMRDHLLSLYSQWATVLGPAVHLAEVFGVSSAIGALAELAIDSAVLGPFAAPIWAAIAPAMATLLTLAIPAPVPFLTPTQSMLVWNGAYCQLTCNGNVVDPTSAQIQAWNAYLTANSGSFSSPSLQLALLNGLLDFTPLLDWQTATATAVANSGCVAFTCP